MTGAEFDLPRHVFLCYGIYIGGAKNVIKIFEICISRSKGEGQAMPKVR